MTTVKVYLNGRLMNTKDVEGEPDVEFLKIAGKALYRAEYADVIQNGDVYMVDIGTDPCRV